MDCSSNTQKIQNLYKVIKKLRSPEGCPWDREQTHDSLKHKLAEECSEVLDAIDYKNYKNLKEELGDVLMHVILHSLIAEEKKNFSFNEVAEHVTKKMMTRHPHIFGNEKGIENSEDVVKLWENIKKQESKDNNNTSNALGNIPKNLSSILKAEKIQRRASSVGFDWDNSRQVIDKIDEELGELKNAINKKNEEEINEELGDLLFSIINLCRFRSNKSAEDLLQNTNRKFFQRFSKLEANLKAQDRNFSDCSINELEELWQDSK